MVDEETASLESNIEELVALAHAQQKIEHELTKWQAVKMYPKSFAWVLYMIWTMILVGYEMQAGGIVFSIPQFRKDFGYKYGDEYVLDASWQSAIAGVPIAAQTFTCFFVSGLADRYGRRPLYMLGLAMTIPGITMEYVSTSVQLFLAGKTINALGLGCFNNLCISYASEIAPMALRGFSAAACSLSLSIGPFVCYLINNTTASYTTRMAYRGVFIPQWIFSVSCILICPFMPESPYYFITKGKNEKALRSLKRLFSSDQAQQHYAIMKVTYEELKLISQSTSYLDCFSRKEIKRTLLIMFAQFMQPMCGIAFVNSYATYFYQLAGFSTKRSYQLACGAQGMAVAGSIVSWFIIDRFGRRPLMLFGIASITILNVIVAGVGTATANPTAMTVASAFLAMYSFFYNTGIGPLAYVFGAEISSVSLRTKAFSFALIMNGGFQCMWSFVLPYMFNPDHANMGSKINFIFAGLSFLSWFVFYFYQPETANRSFEEIDEMYDKKVPARQWKSFKTQKQIDSERVYADLKSEIVHDEYADD